MVFLKDDKNTTSDVVEDKPNLRDFLITEEGLIFAVAGYFHPEDRIIAFLRYYPDNSGERVRYGLRYSKVAGVAQSFEYLKKKHPDYIYRIGDALLQAVPVEKIEEHLKPRERLRQILKKPEDELEQKVSKLSRLLGLKEGKMGVTGSILAELHSATSDIDFVVYGVENHSKARLILRELMETGKLRELSIEEWKKAYEKRFPTQKTLSFEEFLFYERRKWHKGVIDGTIFDILLVNEHPIREEDFIKMGRTKIKAKVVDAALAFDYPAVYRVEGSEVDEVVSYTHTYAGQAFNGEIIEACGVLEVGRNKKRLLVGSTREAEGEYIRVVGVG